MGNLIDFFKRNFHIILFVILQVLSFVLIYNTVNYPRFKLARVGRTVTYPINRIWGGMKHYFHLKSENEGLLQQNMELLREMEQNFMIISDSVHIEEELNDENQKIRIFDYTIAQVIYNTTHKKHNYLILDKGLHNGIGIDMAVFSSQGVMGFVCDVSDHFATVMSLLHPDTRISGRLMPTNQLGTVIWEDTSPEILSLIDIPQHIQVNIGDSVFTSGFSNVFPRDILIGTVSEVEPNTKNSYLTIKLKMSTDMNKVNSVFVVQNLYKQELDQLKNNFKHE